MTGGREDASNLRGGTRSPIRCYFDAYQYAHLCVGAKRNELISFHKQNKYKPDFVGITADTPNNNHVYISKQIQRRSTVLDVGCSQGVLGKLLAEKECIVDGIDIDSDALAVASEFGFYRKLFLFDAQARSGKDYDDFVQMGNKYDYIVKQKGVMFARNITNDNRVSFSHQIFACDIRVS